MRQSGHNSRTGIGGLKAAVLTFLFWAVSGLIMISFLHGGPANMIEAKSEDVGKLYIGSIFPTVSRGADLDLREAGGNKLSTTTVGTTGSNDAGASETVTGTEQSDGILTSMVGSMFPGAEVLDDDLAEEDPGIIFDNTDSDDEKQEEQQSTDGEGSQEDQAETSTEDLDLSKPVVIIYHTHATESYQPVTEGNYHSLNEYGTVREVGDALTKELKAKGIQVIHDKTIHDSPSYNQSYTRSLETVNRLIGSVKSNQLVVIDLHRDAAGYSGNNAKTTEIGNKTVAKYSLVVGNGNPNVGALKQFANQVNSTAESMYPGFGGKIIEKQYKFNQYVSDHHMLLEVGNNMNTIDQAKLTGKYFGDVLAQVIKDME
jgi:stage II sporulation protein P